MKRVVTILSLLLSMAMLLAPVAGGAETLNMVSLQLYDPVATYNGEAAIDLSGLTLQLSGGANADGSLMQLIMDVIGGDTTVASGLVQYDENGLAAFLGGMTNAYGISAEMLASLSQSALEGVTISPDIQSLLTNLQTWTLPELYMARISEYMTNEVTYGEPTTRDIELSTGTVSAQFIPFSGDANQLMSDVVALLDSDPVMTELLTMLYNQGEVYAQTYAELIPVSELDHQLSGGVATGDNYNMMEIILSMDGGEVVNFALNVLQETTESGDIYDISYVITPQGEEFAGQSVYVTANMVENGDNISVDAHAGYNFGESDSMDIALTCSITEAGFEFALADNMDMFNITASATDGNIQVSISSYGETITFYANWDDAMNFAAGLDTGESGALDIKLTSQPVEGYLYNGTLEVSLSDAYGVSGLTMGVALLPGVVDSANTYIAPENVVDITTLTEDDYMAIEQEFYTVINGALTSLMQYVPGLQVLMSY